MPTEDKTVQLAKNAQIKTEDFTDAELEAVTQLFEKKLNEDGKSRRDWLRETYGDGWENKEAPLSNVLAGRRRSTPIIRDVCAYIFN